MFLSLFLLLFQFSIAQDDILPKSEDGYYTFYEVVDAYSIDSTQLLHNAESFLKGYINKKQKKTLTVDKQSGSVQAKSSFRVFKKGTLGKNVDGAVEYSISIDVKDQKYRYIITDFIFQEYEKDRYGKFVPIKGKIKNLEEPVSKLNEWQWDAHKRTVKEKTDELINSLKIEMLKTNQSKKKVKVKKDW